MNVGQVASHAYARRGSVRVDRAAKCPTKNRMSQNIPAFVVYKSKEPIWKILAALTTQIFDLYDVLA